MAKELPYFKFEPAEYLTKDISFCSLSAQGLFIIICSYYWQRGCNLTITQLKKRINCDKELEELIQEDIIKMYEQSIKIDFLDVQLNEVEKTSKTNSDNGKKGGRPKKNNPKESQIKPTALFSLSETKGIREEEIKEEEIKEEEIKEEVKEEVKGEKQKTKKEKIEGFLKWFNSQKKVHTGTLGKFKMLTKTDENNLFKLLKVYNHKDFEEAIPKMYASDWAKENQMFTPTHFLVNNNFIKYLNQELKKEIIGLG